LLDNTLEITLYDKDTIKNDFLGCVKIPLLDLIRSKPVLYDQAPPTVFNLQSKPGNKKVSGDVVLKIGFQSFPTDWFQSIITEESESVDSNDIIEDATESMHS
jgi:hypothetical protein